ncbi:two-component system response regulator RgbR [Spirochaetota bacterium]
MIRIGLCDDEKPDLDHLRCLVEACARDKGISFGIAEFGSGEDLLFAIGKGEGFDIIFLDVYMGLANGVDIAREIREFDVSCSIIFATNSREHAIDGYGVHALQYLLKPLTEKNVSMALELALESISRGKNGCIQLSNKVGTYRILLSEILYAESNARIVTVHCQKRGALDFYIRLDDFERLCDDNRFIRCHKSFLVNLDYVHTISGHSLILETGEEIRMSMRASTAKSLFAAHLARTI